MRKLIFISLIAVLFSCKKEEIAESYVGSTAFYVEGLFGGKYLMIEAGKDDYYMMNGIDQGDTSLPAQFKAELAGLNGFGEKGHVEVIFRNSKYLEIEPGDLNNVLDLINFDYFYGSEEPMARMRFLPQYSSAVSSVAWDFGDSLSSSELTPIHSYNTSGNQSFNVCLNVEYSNGCSDQICSDIFLPDNPCSAEIQYTVDSLGGNSIIYSANVQGVNPIQYTWIFDDTIQVNTAEAKYSYNSSTSKIQHVKLRTFDASGCETNTAIKHPIGLTTECYSNFRAEFLNYEVINSPGFKEVVVNYYDENQTLYSSELGLQEAQANFEVVNHQNYGGKDTEKDLEAVEFKFNCRLYNSDGEIIDVSSASGRMAFNKN